MDGANQTAAQYLVAVRDLVCDDKHALAELTLGGYRAALSRTIHIFLQRLFHNASSSQSLSPSAILERGKAHRTEPAGVYCFSEDELQAFARDLLQSATAADTHRINHLEHAGGHVTGNDAGRPAFRLLGSVSWHPSLREAVDADCASRAAARRAAAAE